MLILFLQCSAQSNQINKSRLNVLEFRDEKLQDIITEAEALLPSIKSDLDAYFNLLYSLCLEVFYRLMETEVTLECLNEDVDIVKAASEKAKNEFFNVTAISMRLSIVPNLKEKE